MNTPFLIHQYSLSPYAKILGVGLDPTEFLHFLPHAMVIQTEKDFPYPSDSFDLILVRDPMYMENLIELERLREKEFGRIHVV